MLKFVLAEVERDSPPAVLRQTALHLQMHGVSVGGTSQRHQPFARQLKARELSKPRCIDPAGRVARLDLSEHCRAPSDKAA